MSIKRYHNAAQVLPRALLKKVQEYCGGMMLYVPHAVNRADFNRLQVLNLKSQGFRHCEIARRLGMTERNVREIVQKDRERAQKLAPQKNPASRHIEK